MRLAPEIRLLLAALLPLAGAAAHATARPPVSWQVKSLPSKPVKAGVKFNVTITGQLDPGGHLYALEEPQGGPVATEVALADGDPADLLRVEEAKPKVLLDPLFGKPTGFFDGSVDFTLHLQAAKNAAAGPRALRILVRYQSCNDRVCLPPHTDTIPVQLTLTR
jgi:hypothetical protein